VSASCGATRLRLEPQRHHPATSSTFVTCWVSRRWMRSLGHRLGGEIVMMGKELVRSGPGYLADILLVDGNPLANVRSCRMRQAARHHEGCQFHSSPTLQERHSARSLDRAARLMSCRSAGLQAAHVSYRR